IFVIDNSPKDYQALQRCFIQLRFSNPIVACSEVEVALNLLDQTIAPNTHRTSKFKPGCILP
ncbi:MAG: hypothetical protein ABI618_19915, partial [Nitrospirota bacterium]